MNKKKRSLGLGLMLMLFLTAVRPVLAEEPTPTPMPSAPTEDHELNMTGKQTDDSLSSTFNGSVKASLLSATLPASVSFTYDPAASFDPLSGKNQVSTPTAFAVTNHSPVSVVLEITAVNVPEPVIGENPLDHSPQTFRLVKTVDEVQQPGTAVMAVRPRGETFASLSEFEQYALNPQREASDPLRVATVPSDQTIPLEIWGKYASDRFYGEYAVKVGITLKIRALTSGENSDYVPEGTLS